MELGLGQTREVGAYADQRLNLAKLGRPREDSQDSEPDLGKSGRPGLLGGLGKRGHGGNVNLPRNRKGEAGNPPPTTGAPELYPDHVRICGRLGVKFPGPTRRITQVISLPGSSNPAGSGRL
jgi:hypothetical protein